MAVEVGKIADIGEPNVTGQLPSRILTPAHHFAGKIKEGVQTVIQLALQQSYPGQPYLLKRVEEWFRRILSRHVWPQGINHD